ncbi:MAG TPA: hypothetical protein PLP58_04175 [Prosthecobacter sp.]|nr:hypothetical protein [Prosthecobacter sp.]
MTEPASHRRDPEPAFAIVHQRPDVQSFQSFCQPEMDETNPVKPR